MEKIISEILKEAKMPYNNDIFDRLLKEIWTSYLRLKNYALGTINNPDESTIPAFENMNRQYEQLEFAILEVEKDIKKKQIVIK